MLKNTKKIVLKNISFKKVLKNVLKISVLKNAKHFVLKNISVKNVLKNISVKKSSVFCISITLCAILPQIVTSQFLEQKNGKNSIKILDQ